MSFDRTQLPTPASYYESQGLTLKGRGRWRTARCPEHGGESLGINIESGGYCCRGGCDFSGGDVLSYHMRTHGLDFVAAAKQLGAWIDDGQPHRQYKPAPLSPRDALAVIAFEVLLIAVAAGNVAHGRPLTEPDRFRLMKAAARINRLMEAYS